MCHVSVTLSSRGNVGQSRGPGRPTRSRRTRDRQPDRELGEACNRQHPPWSYSLLLQRSRFVGGCDGVCKRDWPVVTHHGVATAIVPVIFSTFFTSLRIPNPEMTSMAPRMVSQAPTTRANVSIESNGYASITKPAMTLIDPKTIAHPRPGNRGTLIADAATNTPRMMNPIATQMASKRIAY